MIVRTLGYLLAFLLMGLYVGSLMIILGVSVLLAFIWFASHYA